TQIPAASDGLVRNLQRQRHRRISACGIWKLHIETDVSQTVRIQVGKVLNELHLCYVLVDRIDDDSSESIAVSNVIRMDLQLPKQRMHDQFRARILDKHECRTFYFATLDPPSASRGLLWDIDDVFARRRIELARRALRERHFSRGRNKRALFNPRCPRVAIWPRARVRGRHLSAERQSILSLNLTAAKPSEVIGA